jgi:hypothetical protein
MRNVKNVIFRSRIISIFCILLFIGATTQFNVIDWPIFASIDKDDPEDPPNPRIAEIEKQIEELKQKIEIAKRKREIIRNKLENNAAHKELLEIIEQMKKLGKLEEILQVIDEGSTFISLVSLIRKLVVFGALEAGKAVLVELAETFGLEFISIIIDCRGNIDELIDKKEKLDNILKDQQNKIYDLNWEIDTSEDTIKGLQRDLELLRELDYENYYPRIG